ncbi:uncharacterized protein ACO6RY_10028 [Pungitius sinensis]
MCIQLRTHYWDYHRQKNSDSDCMKTKGRGRLAEALQAKSTHNTAVLIKAAQFLSVFTEHVSATALGVLGPEEGSPHSSPRSSLLMFDCRRSQL